MTFGRGRQLPVAASGGMVDSTIDQRLIMADLRTTEYRVFETFYLFQALLVYFSFNWDF